MADETPTGDKAVYVFIEMIALAFILYAVEEAFSDKPSWLKVIVALVLGLSFFLLGIKWTKLKGRIHLAWTRRIDRIANDYRYRYGASILLIGLIGFFVLNSLHGLRQDIDEYLTPRTVTQEETDKLREYLAAHDAGAVNIRVVQHDQEAMEYAGELFNSMRQTNWDVNPPNHDGIAYIQDPMRTIEPKPADADSNGNPIYKDTNDFLIAHDAWLETRISNEFSNQINDTSGLCVQVDLPGQPQNPDPRRPDPALVLRDAMDHAGIEVNCLGGAADMGKYTIFLTVGHRPRVMGQGPPMRYKIARWIMRMGR